LRVGEVFRVRGGPTYNGSRVGIPGLYRLLGVEKYRQRVYLLGVPVDKYGVQRGGTVLLYVSGKPYRLEGLPNWVCKPYKISKKRVP
jgi:hypothetical protein